MTLKEAFSLLITQRLFLAGKSIPEERMREYLRAAGWEQIQEEQWAEK